MKYLHFASDATAIFDRAIAAYHATNSVDAIMENPCGTAGLDPLLYRKSWIDTVQWHLEDIIRKPDIDPVEALQIKRRIDKSNQERTDIVEDIDTFFLDRYKNVEIAPNAGLNTESPAWAIDRLSILALKICHMQEETRRTDATQTHIDACALKLGVLLEQRKDLSQAIDELLDDIASGRKYMKTYKQMKMYNDPSLNPVLYNINKNKI
jgi:hypothetical protein